MEFEYKRNHSASERRNECDKVRQSFPDKIPVICEKDPKCKLQPIDKTKFLIPGELTVAQFGFMIRQRTFLEKEQALFILFQGDKNPPLDCLMSEIYERYKDPEDGYLYATYSSELVWGN
jgi:GABA(A) receptor-associated protein